MATSTLPTARGNLFDGLLALQATTLAGVDVVYGPDEREPERETIWVDVARDESDQRWAAMGGPSSGNAREEEYFLRVVVYCATPGKTQREATERAYALWAIVEDYVRTNHTLGLAAARVPRVEVSGGLPIEFPVDAEGRGAIIDSRIRVRARI